MSFVITDRCVSCGACADACPVMCIHEGDVYYQIDKERCIECGTCLEVCPVDAPEEE